MRRDQARKDRRRSARPTPEIKRLLQELNAAADHPFRAAVRALVRGRPLGVIGTLEGEYGQDWPPLPTRVVSDLVDHYRDDARRHAIDQLRHFREDLRECPTCTREFLAAHDRRKFCSDVCRTKYHTRRRPPRRTDAEKKARAAYLRQYRARLATQARVTRRKTHL